MGAWVKVAARDAGLRQRAKALGIGDGRGVYVGDGRGSGGGDLGDLLSGRSVAPTLTSWMREHFACKEAEGARDVDNERRRARVHVEREAIGAMPLVDVDERAARAWVERLCAKGSEGRGERRRGKPLSARTVSNVLIMVRVAFERAREAGLVESNPFERVRVPRARRRDARVDEPWTVLESEEQAALASVLALERAEVRAMVLVALGLGLRKAELLSLCWEDVHGLEGDAPWLLVRYGKPGKPTKGGKPRRVPLFGHGERALREWWQRTIRRARQETSLGTAAAVPAGLVFPNSRGKARQKVPASAFARAIARAGIVRHVRWQDLRHTCATSLLEGMWGPAWTAHEVQQLLGHSSVLTTERRYIHGRNRLVFKRARESYRFFGDVNQTGLESVRCPSHEGCVSEPGAGGDAGEGSHDGGFSSGER